MFTKKYQLINNVTGWIVFAIALVTYWLTLEPTASYWDCGEFIIQADKLEVGHPPGNPIFMLTARFFANFAPDAASVSVAVNAMSGLLSALTILLLFWTITHLVRRLVVKDGQHNEPSMQQYLAIMGSGVVGALAYCWSDTFWFSAVEGEVYAFSSFCTALVFWLILKWENRADEPHSDRYLVLIAYIIGVSVAVHLLNLLCIPAIVLVFAYRKYKNMNLKKSLLALLVSFAIIALVLYGLVPGFIKVAQQFELLFVNSLGMGFNSGAFFYAVLTAAIFIWALFELRRQKSPLLIKISFIAAVAVSGMLFFGNGIWTGLILLIILAAWLFSRFSRGLSVRVLTVVMWSIAVIFAGYSSYALILIRSAADTPMNQNSPDNVFDLASYLNREQYGENPLIYGETLYSAPMKELQGGRRDTVQTTEDGSPIILSTPFYRPVVNPGKALYAKGVKDAEPSSSYGFLNESEIENNRRLARRGGDYYVKSDYKPEMKLNPELNMLFPRIYSPAHRQLYGNWVNLDTMPENMVTINAIDPATGEKVPELDTSLQPYYNNMTGMAVYPEKQAYRPSYSQNLQYFFNYQLNHMYLRYFMWNFAGRQNDINNQFGELDAGNWISGIPFIDNARIGDQSLLPDDLGKNNKGHNVYYMLPLILGIIGLLWQAFAGKRGIEQFWVVFFLFFMTGIAIVIYLNQPPNQPRERDYAFAGSFYAYAIWIGMGVAALWRLFLSAVSGKKQAKTSAKADDTEYDQIGCIVDEPASRAKASRICAAVAVAAGLIVPIQMVSQTWDDHDRSGRYAARDYAINYLNSLEPDAIIFCNGDNDTFPLWYAQEVEGVRQDVKIINLSYLNSDWYANQMRMQSYTAAPVPMTALPKDIAYGSRDVVLVGDSIKPMNLLQALKLAYTGNGIKEYGYPTIPTSTVTIPIDKKTALAKGLLNPRDEGLFTGEIIIDLKNTETYRKKGYLSLGEILMLDIIATDAAQGWKRPVYWASTVGNEYHVGLTPYLKSTGMAHQLTATIAQNLPTRTYRAYRTVTGKYLWGGADNKENAPYFDETAGRMLATMRTSMTDLASQLIFEGDLMRDKEDRKGADANYAKALKVLDMMQDKLHENTLPHSLSVITNLGQFYCELGSADRMNSKALTGKGLSILEKTMRRYAPYVRYHMAMTSEFTNPQFTLETRYIPYQYYRFIELYEQFGGKKGTVDSILKQYGINRRELRQNYQNLYGGGAQTASAEDLQEYGEAVLEYARVANRLKGLSPEEYAAAPADERMMDSVVWQLLEYYRQNGGDMKKLESNTDYKALDIPRQQRLTQQYIQSHPELGY